MAGGHLLFGAVLLSLSGVAVSGPASAQTAPAPDAFQQAFSAQAVAAFARRQRDPEAMIVAARMLQEVPVKEGAASQPGITPSFSPAALYAEAGVLANGDPALLTQIRIGQSSGSRGVLASAFGQGLVRLVREVAARSSYRFTIDAMGGQMLRIGAIGDVGTAILLRLVDAAGRVVCLDDTGSYAPVCATLPHATGRFAVEIANRSAKSSSTVILSN